MYSREERMKAVEIYIKYDKSAADAICELGEQKKDPFGRRPEK